MQPETAKVVKRSNRGSKPGERRGGRVAGTPNRATAAIKEIAGRYTEQAVNTLVSILAGGEGIPAAAQVAAAKELLDRAHGKPGMHIDNTSSDGSMTPRGIDASVLSDAALREVLAAGRAVKSG
jgi:hypothetical protein